MAEGMLYWRLGRPGGTHLQIIRYYIYLRIRVHRQWEDIHEARVIILIAKWGIYKEITKRDGSTWSKLALDTCIYTQRENKYGQRDGKG